jgi:hypothetical protein
MIAPFRRKNLTVIEQMAERHARAAYAAADALMMWVMTLLKSLEANPRNPHNVERKSCVAWLSARSGRCG